MARPMMHAFGAKPRIVTVDVNQTPCKRNIPIHSFKLNMRAYDPKHPTLSLRGEQ